MAEAVAWARLKMAEGGRAQVITVNGAMLVNAARDARLRRLFNQADLILPDGIGVLLAGAILGRRFRERVPGVDFVERLCKVCAQDGFRVYLLGGAPGIAEAAATAWQSRYPGIAVAGVAHGYFSAEEEGAVIDRIRAVRPHLLLVALGALRQEEWIAAHRDAVGASVSIGVGGTFDVVAGRVRRAPGWMQRAGLEWAYRFAQEPRRWRVIVTLPLAVLLALWERITRGWKQATKRG